MEKDLIGIHTWVMWLSSSAVDVTVALTGIGLSSQVNKLTFLQ